jgi:hypothetical protein
MLLTLDGSPHNAALMVLVEPLVTSQGHFEENFGNSYVKQGRNVKCEDYNDSGERYSEMSLEFV